MKIRSFPLPAPLLLVLTVALAAACTPGTPVGPDPESTIVPVGRPVAVRGIYVNARVAGSATELARLVDLADSSDVNTFVIDVKERGEVSWASTVPLVAEIGAARDFIPDLRSVLRLLRDHGIYPIARIVCFYDPVLAGARPEWAIRTTGGDVWLDPQSDWPWVDPYRPEVWAYNIALAREALAAGFAEVQWDYVRFPDVTAEEAAGMVYPSSAGRSVGEGIEGFVVASRAALAEFDAPITADVFGRVISVPDDDGIGQGWNRLIRVTDVLLPMVYPALYGPGTFGIADPNAEPYRLVRTAMDSAVVRLNRTSGATATIRPWLQGFTLGTTAYGAQEIRDQIRAVEDAGLTEWLVWNPDGVYPVDGLR